jgi:hypothetical protein
MARHGTPRHRGQEPLVTAYGNVSSPHGNVRLQRKVMIGIVTVKVVLSKVTSTGNLF